MEKVFIAVGHGGADPGAVGHVREKDANLEIALELKWILEKAGVAIGISRIKDENDPVSEEVKEANAFKPRLAVAIHNNAGGGDGFEAWVQTNAYASQSRRAAELIEKYVKAMGQNSRGIKSKKRSDGKDSLASLRGIEAPTVVLEGFFVDNQKDAIDFDTPAEQRKLAAAYAAGILEYLGVATKEETKDDGKRYCVQLGVYANKAGAEEMLMKLKKEGFVGYITTTTRKTNTEIAEEVKLGKWGNGAERKTRLTEAGYDAAAIQKIVNGNK